MACGLLESDKKLAKTPQKRLLTDFCRLGGTSYHPKQNKPLKSKIMCAKNLLLILLEQKVKQNVSKHTSKTF